MPKFNPQPKKGMPPKKAKKPLKRSPIKKKYESKSKWNNPKENESKGRSGGNVETKRIHFKNKNSLGNVKRKSTGEAKVFQAILEQRGPYSQISGQYLGEGFNPWWFSHVVPKSIAPELRLDERNIILKTPDEHATWENKKHTIRDSPKWKWVFELEEQLKIEINNR